MYIDEAEQLSEAERYIDDKLTERKASMKPVSMKINKNSSRVKDIETFINSLGLPFRGLRMVSKLTVPPSSEQELKAVVYEFSVIDGVNLRVVYYPEQPEASEADFIFGKKLKMSADLYKRHEEEFEFIAEAIREYPVIEDKIYRRNAYIETKESLQDALDTAEKLYEEYK